MSAPREAEIVARLTALKRAARALRALPSAAKDRALKAAADGLEASKHAILEANRQDLDALPASATAAFRDRLGLDDRRLEQMAESLRQVAALPDPVGELVENRRLANGLKVSRIRSPLGVILMVFESRPNVATEAFGLAFKAGNVAILRGGKESMRSTGQLYEVLGRGLAEAGISKDVFWGITDPDRAITEFLLKQRAFIDIVVPRGGDSLIEFVTENTRIPVIKNDRGLCHVYVHEDADLDMAASIVANAKCQRPGVCNSMETLLVHQKAAPELLKRLQSLDVEWHADPRALQLLSASGGAKRARAATEKDWDTEYLDLILNCRVVDSYEQALEHIELHGSRHSEAIITRSRELSLRFQEEVDAAAVYWNASTRFTDGFELGLGGELGISTQKLHVRGPVGLRELTSVRWIIDGEGQVRT